MRDFLSALESRRYIDGHQPKKHGDRPSQSRVKPVDVMVVPLWILVDVGDFRPNPGPPLSRRRAYLVTVRTDLHVSLAGGHLGIVDIVTH
jgi:hypothetical protein